MNKNKNISINFINDYFSKVSLISNKMISKEIDDLINQLVLLKKRKGRLFFLGVGGSAGNASHAVNDFRKLCNIESYSPTDNVSELTARINDEGWESSFVNWLKVSKINKKDSIFIFSVGGGNLEKNISVNIVNSIKLAKEVGAKVVGIVGKNGGYTKEVADETIIISSFNANTVTPQTESFQAFIWHLIVTHPDIIKNKMKWESIDK